MNAPALNLLRYPRRQALVGTPVLVRVLAGALAGGLCASAWGLWSQMRYSQELQRRDQLHTSTRAQARAQAEASARAQQHRLQQQAHQRAEDGRARREQMQRLHALLLQERHTTGLHLQRWQGDGQRLQLQAWLPRAEDLPGLQARLSAAGPQVWTLHSLGRSTDRGLQLVLESSWPALAAPAPAAGPAAKLPASPGARP